MTLIGHYNVYLLTDCFTNTCKYKYPLYYTSGVYDGLGSLVVMYKENPFITSTSLSPTLTLNMVPDFIKFFSSTLSSAGSSSSSTSSMRRGLPRERQSSR